MTLLGAYACLCELFCVRVWQCGRLYVCECLVVNALVWRQGLKKSLASKQTTGLKKSTGLIQKPTRTGFKKTHTSKSTTSHKKKAQSCVLSAGPPSEARQTDWGPTTKPHVYLVQAASCVQRLQGPVIKPQVFKNNWSSTKSMLIYFFLFKPLA